MSEDSCQKAQTVIIAFAQLTIDEIDIETFNEAIWLIASQTAVLFMKKPELMYRIFNDFDILANSEWTDTMFSLLEEAYDD